MDYAQIRERLINSVLSKRDGLTVNEIVEKFKGSAESLFQDPVDAKQIRDVLQKESRDPDGVIMLCSRKRKGANQYKVRPARVRGPYPRQKPTTDTLDTNYIGRAGEFAVLSELIASGYNANNMTIDEGIDIVASKDNIFYYIQVKTTYMDDTRRVSIHIPVANYDRVQRNNVIYIIAVRESIGAYRYFIFHQYEIENLKIGRYIEQTDANINIKIAYNDVTNEPYLYNGKETTSAKPYQAEVKGFKL